MNGAPKVAVVGAGVLGLSSAMWAAEAGAQVSIIERAHIAAGSSGLSAGIVGTHYTGPADIEIRKHSLNFFTQHGDAVGFVATGVLRVAATAAELNMCEQSASLQRQCGVTAVEVLEQAGVARLVPEMRVDDLVGGIWMADSGHIDGHLACTYFLEVAQAAGAHFMPGAELIGAERRRGGWELDTTRGRVSCDAVINAAGAWSERVGEIVGHAVRIIPQRHEMAIAKLARPREVPMPNVGVYFAGPDGAVSGDGLYWRSESADRLLVSVHTGFDPDQPAIDPDDWSRTVSDETIELLAEKLDRRLPGLADMGLARGWAGLYPMTLDDQVVIGPWNDEPTLIEATGGGGFGLQISPEAGRIAAQWATGQEPTGRWVHDLLPDRASLTPRHAKAPSSSIQR